MPLPRFSSLSVAASRNVLNPHSADELARSLAAERLGFIDDRRSGAIEAWLSTTGRKHWLKHGSSRPASQEEAEAHGAAWAVEAFRSGSLTVLNLAAERAQAMEIIDWMMGEPSARLARLPFAEAILKSKAWHEKVSLDASLAEDPSQLLPICSSSNGLRWVELRTPEELGREGRLMRHCVGSYAVRVANNQCRIFSLRSASNEPLLTVEARAAEPSTAPDSPEGSMIIAQIKGKANALPGSEQAVDIRRLLTELGSRGTPVSRVEDLASSGCIFSPESGLRLIDELPDGHQFNEPIVIGRRVPERMASFIFTTVKFQGSKIMRPMALRARELLFVDCEARALAVEAIDPSESSTITVAGSAEIGSMELKARRVHVASWSQDSLASCPEPWQAESAQIILGLFQSGSGSSPGQRRASAIISIEAREASVMGLSIAELSFQLAATTTAAAAAPEEPVSLRSSAGIFARLRSALKLTGSSPRPQESSSAPAQKIGAMEGLRLLGCRIDRFTQGKMLSEASACIFEGSGASWPLEARRVGQFESTNAPRALSSIAEAVGLRKANGAKPLTDFSKAASNLGAEVVSSASAGLFEGDSPRDEAWRTLFSNIQNIDSVLARKAPRAISIQGGIVAISPEKLAEEAKKHESNLHELIASTSALFGGLPWAQAAAGLWDCGQAPSLGSSTLERALKEGSSFTLAEWADASSGASAEEFGNWLCLLGHAEPMVDTRWHARVWANRVLAAREAVDFDANAHSIRKPQSISAFANALWPGLNDSFVDADQPSMELATEIYAAIFTASRPLVSPAQWRGYFPARVALGASIAKMLSSERREQFMHVPLIAPPCAPRALLDCFAGAASLTVNDLLSATLGASLAISAGEPVSAGALAADISLVFSPDAPCSTISRLAEQACEYGEKSLADGLLEDSSASPSDTRALRDNLDSKLEQAPLANFDWDACSKSFAALGVPSAAAAAKAAGAARPPAANFATARSLGLDELAQALLNSASRQTSMGERNFMASEAAARLVAGADADSEFWGGEACINLLFAAHQGNVAKAFLDGVSVAIEARAAGSARFALRALGPQLELLVGSNPEHLTRLSRLNIKEAIGGQPSRQLGMGFAANSDGLDAGMLIEAALADEPFPFNWTINWTQATKKSLISKVVDMEHSLFAKPVGAGKRPGTNHSLSHALVDLLSYAGIRGRISSPKP